MTTKIAIVGAGYVSDMYVSTLTNHPHLQLAGLHDINRDRANRHSDRWNVPAFDTLDGLIHQSGAELIHNLTNPRSHYEVTNQCLSAGKHDYSEKPFGMPMEEGRK